MIRTDNTNVEIRSFYRENHSLKILKKWLDERQVKYSLVFSPAWDSEPSYINLRNEDAVAFKLAFGL